MCLYYLSHDWQDGQRTCKFFSLKRTFEDSHYLVVFRDWRPQIRDWGTLIKKVTLKGSQLKSFFKEATQLHTSLQKLSIRCKSSSRIPNPNTKPTTSSPFGDIRDDSVRVRNSGPVFRIFLIELGLGHVMFCCFTLACAQNTRAPFKPPLSWDPLRACYFGIQFFIF